METKNKNNDLKVYLQSLFTINEFENLHKKLGLSKRGLTLYSKRPGKITLNLLIKLSHLTGQPIEQFTKFVDNSIK